METAKILIVEDEAVIAKDLQWRLEGMGYDVPLTVANGEEAVDKATEINPDLVLMDIVLIGQMDGIEAAEQIRSKADIPVIYLTAYADEQTFERAKVTEPFGYLIKPIRDKELHISIEMALYQHSMEKKLRESKKLLSTVLNSTNDGVITTCAKGRVTYMNPAAEKLTGWKQEEAIGNTLEKVFDISNKISNKEMGKKVEKSVKGGIENELIVGLTNDTILITRKGTRIPLYINPSPIKDERGDVNAFVLVFNDVT
jgi:PAS domain S-box-containing protein